MQNEHSLGYPGWRVVAASAAALAFGPSTIAVLGLALFMLPIQNDFGWTRPEVAIATTIISYMIVVVSPLQGWLLDRFGARKVMLPSIPLFALGVFALSQIPPSHTLWRTLWFVLPVLGLGLFPLSYLRTVATWFKSRLGLALGITNAGVGIGGILVTAIAGYVIANHGWRPAYMVFAAIVLLVTFPLVYFFVREAPAEPGAEKVAVTATSGPPGATFKEAARTPTFALLLLAFIFLGIINTALIVHQPSILQDRGMSPAMVTQVQIVFAVFGLLGRLITGYLLDRWKASIVMAIFSLGGAAACVLYATGAAGGTAFLCSALIGLMFGAEFDVLAYIIKAKFGVRAFGKIYGAIFAVFQFGAGFGAWLLPNMRQQSGSYDQGLWIFAVLLVLSAATILCVRGVPRLSAQKPEGASA